MFLFELGATLEVCWEYSQFNAGDHNWQGLGLHNGAKDQIQASGMQIAPHPLDNSCILKIVFAFLLFSLSI